MNIKIWMIIRKILFLIMKWKVLNLNPSIAAAIGSSPSLNSTLSPVIQRKLESNSSQQGTPSQRHHTSNSVGNSSAVAGYLGSNLNNEYDTTSIASISESSHWSGGAGDDLDNVALVNGPDINTMENKDWCSYLRMSKNGYNSSDEDDDDEEDEEDDDEENDDDDDNDEDEDDDDEEVDDDEPSQGADNDENDVQNDNHHDDDDDDDDGDLDENDPDLMVKKTKIKKKHTTTNEKIKSSSKSSSSSIAAANSNNKTAKLANSSSSDNNKTNHKQSSTSSNFVKNNQVNFEFIDLFEIRSNLYYLFFNFSQNFF